MLFVSTVAPLACISVAAVLWMDIARRLLYPADLGSGGKEVVDLENEAREAVGLYIKRDEFPDRLFAPPKRTTFIEDDANPIYDKENAQRDLRPGHADAAFGDLRSPCSWRLPIMAACLYMFADKAPWYIAYVLLFNMLVGPVFSAGSVCNERERQTLDLLLTTLITPWQMLWGKLLRRAARVGGAHVLLAVAGDPGVPDAAGVLEQPAHHGGVPVGGRALVPDDGAEPRCSARRSTARPPSSLMTTYVVILTMFVAPLAATVLCRHVLSGNRRGRGGAQHQRRQPLRGGLCAAARDFDQRVAERGGAGGWGDLPIFYTYVGWTVLYNLALLILIVWLFHARWRVSE